MHKVLKKKHFERCRYNEVMGKIPNRKVRVQKLAQRSQSTFIEGLPESLNFLEQADKDVKCCVPYVCVCVFFLCVCVYLFLTTVHSSLFLFFLPKLKLDLEASTISLLIEQGWQKT
jgi:hypothetical protein